MLIKEYQLDASDRVPLASFLDEFNIVNCDARRLKICVDLDYSGVYYAGENPTICVVIEYDNKEQQ